MARNVFGMERLAGMHPAYFALVMATGIVSIAAYVVGSRFVAGALLVLNSVLYCIVWALTIARFVLHRDRVVADVFSHNRSVGFFTTVAATNVLGSQVLVTANPSWSPRRSGSSGSSSGRSSRTGSSRSSP